LSEARQKSAQKDVSKDVELVKQQRREKQAEQEKQKKAAKIGTEAGQDPENRNIYDSLAYAQEFLKNDTRIKTTQQKQNLRIQEQQLEQTKQEYAEAKAQESQYDPESFRAYESDVRTYINEATRNTRSMEVAIQAGEKNIATYNQNIKTLRSTAINPPTPKREPVKSQNRFIVGPPEPKDYDTNDKYRRPWKARETEVLIDAKGGTEQSIGAEATSQIRSINPTAYEKYTREKQAQQFEDYENRFHISTELRQTGYQLGVEAREPLEKGKPADLLKITAGAGLRFTGGAFDFFTRPIRPGLVTKDVFGAVGLLSSKGRTQAVAAFAEDPTGAIFEGLGEAGGAVVMGAAFPRTTRTSEYRYPSELTGKPSKPPGKGWVDTYQPPKGTTLYKDVYGNVKYHYPTRVQWRDGIFFGGDQFINQDFLLTQRTTTPSLITKYPYQSFSRTPGISPIKVTRTTITPRIGPAAGLFGLLPEKQRTDTRQETENTAKPKPQTRNKPREKLDINIIPTDKTKPIVSPISAPIETPIPVEIETQKTAQKTKPVLSPINLEVTEPQPPRKPYTPPRPPTPTPTLFKSPKKPRIGIKPVGDQKRRSRKKGFNPIGFELRSTKVKTPTELLGGGSKKRKKGWTPF